MSLKLIKSVEIEIILNLELFDELIFLNIFSLVIETYVKVCQIYLLIAQNKFKIKWCRHTFLIVFSKK